MISLLLFHVPLDLFLVRCWMDVVGNAHRCLALFCVLGESGESFTMNMVLSRTALFPVPFVKSRKLPFMTVLLHVFIVSGSLNFVKRLFCIF